MFSCHLHLGVPHWLAVSCLFVSIELQLQEINPAIRNGVYSHLEAFVPCNKDTLIKRLKKLHLNVQVMGGRVAPVWVSYVTVRKECRREEQQPPLSAMKQKILEHLLDQHKCFFFLCEWSCHYLKNKYFKYFRPFYLRMKCFHLESWIEGRYQSNRTRKPQSWLRQVVIAIAFIFVPRKKRWIDNRWPAYIICANILLLWPSLTSPLYLICSCFFLKECVFLSNKKKKKKRYPWFEVSWPGSLDENQD